MLMQSYENAICISGTHGKTTTTSMVTHILLAAQQDPTVMIGGICPFSMPATGWARETPLCWRAASIVTRF